MDPLDLSQWRFLVLATQALNDRLGEQKTLALGSLMKLEPAIVAHGEICAAVQLAARQASP